MYSTLIDLCYPTAKLEACVEAAIRKEAILKQNPPTEEVCYMKNRNSKSCYVCGDTSHGSQSFGESL